MAVTENTYTGNGSTTNYSFTFPYLEETDIKVSLDGVLTTAYTLANATTVSFTSAPGNGVAIRIYRETNADTLQATFFAGSAIRAQDLNDNFNQVLYNTQETVDRRLDRTGGTMSGNIEFAAGKGIVFEGTTNDANEVTLLGGDPSADRTLNLPNASGTLVSTGDVGTIATSMIADSNVTTAKIADSNVTTAKIADSAVTSAKIADGTITTADIADGAVTSAKIADGTIVAADIASNAVTTAKILDANVTTAKIADSNVTTAKIADGNVTTVKILDANVTTAKIADSNVTTAKIADSNVTTAKIADSNVTTAKIADSAVTAAKIADGVITSAKLTDGTVVTNAEHSASTPNDTSFFTTSASDARYFRQDSTETIFSGDTWSSSDSRIASTAAIDARIIDLVDDVGGFVPIANETSFPLTNPDINNPDGAGTIISIKEISTSRTPSSGIVTIANGAGTNTVTINGCGSTVLAAGFGVLVETTSTLHTYTFHRLVPKATEVTTVAGISSDVTTVATNSANVTAVASNAANINTVAGSIANVNNVGGSIANVNSVASSLNTVNDFAARYRVSSTDPTTSLDTGDLVFNTTNNELRVFNGSAWQGGVTATGNLVSKSGDTLTGPLGITAGTAALPSLFISGDPNTGAFSPGADQLSFTTGGTERLSISAAGVVNVPGALTKGGSNVVTVGDTGTVTSTMIADGTIVNGDINASAAIAGTKISPDFGSQNTTTTGTSTAASFIPTSSTAPSNGVYLPAANNVAISTNGTGRLFVDSSGLVGVGVTPTEKFQVGATNNSTVAIKVSNSGTYGFLQQNATSGTGAIELGSSGAFPLVLSTNQTERLRITSDGKLGLGTSAPAGKAMILGSDTTSFGTITNGALNLGTTNGTTNGRYVNLNFGYDTGATNAPASIGFTYTAQTGNGAGSLQFGTRSVTTDTAPDVRMTITSAGNVGIGDTAPDNKLVVRDAGNVYIKVVKTLENSTYIGSESALGLIASDSALSLRVGGQTSTYERARIDSSGRLLVGTSTSSGYNGEQYVLQTSSDSGSTQRAGLSMRHVGNDNNGARLVFAKSRGTGTTIVQSGDSLGQIIWYGADGNDIDNFAALIACEVDGTPGSNDMPGRLVFSTTADGASSPTERARITNGGWFKISNTGSYNNAAAAFHEARSDQNNVVWKVTNSSGSGYTDAMLVSEFTGYAPNNTTARFLYCGDTSAERCTIRSNGGIANFSANNVNLSDQNFKKDIAPTTGTWDCLKEWEIVNFRYKDQPNDADLNMGVIAQQVAESCPEVITVFQEATEDQPEKLGVKEQQMMWMAIKALQEAQLRIETLEAEVAALKGA